MWTLPSEPWCTPNKQPFKGILVHFQTNFGAVQLIDEFIQTSQKHDVMAWCDHTKGPLFWILHKCYNVFVTIPSFVRMCHECNKSSTQHCFGCSVSSQNIYLNSFPVIDRFFQHVWDSASPPLIEFSDFPCFHRCTVGGAIQHFLILNVWIKTPQRRSRNKWTLMNMGKKAIIKIKQHRNQNYLMLLNEMMNQKVV